MGIRIGVDVGGTFTKAVAWDTERAELTAQHSILTTHTAPEGVAAGVVEAVVAISREVGASRVELVTHSTTQAVNALLEGDVGTVGVIGLGRQPEIKRARARTSLEKVELSSGKQLRTRSAFFDVTVGLDEAGVRSQLKAWRDEGVSAVCVAEAFSPDDPTNEAAVVAMASEIGLPACASTELTGLYGLELRAVTAAVNASILPIAVRTAAFVEEGARAAGLTAPLMVMRGDGGATDLDGFRKGPARTLYSGPAASVAGALRFTDAFEGLIVEVGGTSTNVAVVRGGRPSMAYVRVASHATAVRAVDVRVVGVAGGSMLRTRRARVFGVGPRSAHIAGLPYACFLSPEAFDGAVPELIAPKPGDPSDYLVLRLADQSLAALTTTCAANALGIVSSTDHAAGNREAAIAAYRAAGGMHLAEQQIWAAGEAVADLIDDLARSQKLRKPTIVAVGGGAGGLGRQVAKMLGLDIVVPPGAEVISSIGDALSLVRVEKERTVAALDAVTAKQLLDEAEAEALAAGASPASLEVRLEELPEKGTVRAIATGAVGLTAGARPGREPLSPVAALQLATEPGQTVEAAGAYWLVIGEHIDVHDRYGDRVETIVGERTTLDRLAETTARHTHHRGPIVARPTVWLIDGARFLEMSTADVASITELTEHTRQPTILVGLTR